MNNKKNSDQGTQDWACSHLIHYRKPTLYLTDPHCSLAVPISWNYCWKLLSPFTDRALLCLFVSCHIHHPLSTHRGYTIGLYYCAGVQISVPLLQRPKPWGQHTMAIRQRDPSSSLTYICTLTHKHVHTNILTYLTCTNTTGTTPSHLEYESSGWASGPSQRVSSPHGPHARSPAMQLPSTLQARSPWDATQTFSLLQTSLSASDIHHVS